MPHLPCLSSLMATCDNETMQPTPSLRAGEKEHVLIPQDECLAHTNDTPHDIWAQFFFFFTLIYCANKARSPVTHLHDSSRVRSCGDLTVYNCC